MKFSSGKKIGGSINTATSPRSVVKPKKKQNPPHVKGTIFKTGAVKISKSVASPVQYVQAKGNLNTPSPKNNAKIALSLNQNTFCRLRQKIIKIKFPFPRATIAKTPREFRPRWRTSPRSIFTISTKNVKLFKILENISKNWIKKMKLINIMENRSSKSVRRSWVCWSVSEASKPKNHFSIKFKTSDFASRIVWFKWYQKKSENVCKIRRKTPQQPPE